MDLRPSDIVRPTTLCLSTIRQFKSEHRGKVLGFPDHRFRTTKVKWQHKKKAVTMAERYIEFVVE